MGVLDGLGRLSAQLAKPVVARSLIGAAQSVVLSRGISHDGKKVHVVPTYTAMNPDCPVNRSLIGATVWCDQEGNGHVQLPLSSHPNSARLTNSANTIQGGIQGVLHDLAACVTVHNTGKSGSHIAMNTTFVSPIAQQEGTLDVYCIIVDKKNSHMFLRSHLTVGGELKSTCSHIVRTGRSEKIPA